MKNISYFLLFLFLCSNLYGQNFQGHIRYKMSCRSNLQNVPGEQICFGTPEYVDYYIKAGNYKFISNDSSLLTWLLYINSDDKIYSKIPTSDTIFWKDATVEPDSILQVKINKNVIELIGYKCDEIIFTCKNSIHKYYYSTNILIDKSLYVKHRNSNLYDFLLLSNSLPLKEVLESQYSILEYTAVEIQPMALDDDFFKLPVNCKIAKSEF